MARYCRDDPLHSWLHLQKHSEKDGRGGDCRKCSQSQPLWKAFLTYDKENRILEKKIICLSSDRANEENNHTHTETLSRTSLRQGLNYVSLKEETAEQ